MTRTCARNLAILVRILTDHNELLNVYRSRYVLLPTRRVIRILEQLGESRGLPSMIRVDNGPKFISQRLDMWCKDRTITLASADVTSPTNRGSQPRTRMSNG